VQKLLNYISEHCGEYALIEGLTMKAKPGYQFSLDKYPHNCGNKFRVVTDTATNTDTATADTNLNKSK
jgi:hypothetical protein